MSSDCGFMINTTFRVSVSFTGLVFGYSRNFRCQVALHKFVPIRCHSQTSSISPAGVCTDMWLVWLQQVLYVPTHSDLLLKRRAPGGWSSVAELIPVFLCGCNSNSPSYFLECSLKKETTATREWELDLPVSEHKLTLQEGSEDSNPISAKTWRLCLDCVSPM